MGGLLGGGERVCWPPLKLFGGGGGGAKNTSKTSKQQIGQSQTKKLDFFYCN